MLLYNFFRFCTFFTVMLLLSCQTPVPDAPLQTSDAIVLLAGNRLERVPAAARLFHEGYAKKIILTNDGVGGGWSKQHGRNLTVIEWTEEQLVSLGIPRPTIAKLPFYKSGTIYDALAVMRYSKSNRLKKLIIVTSDYHAQRTLLCFRSLSEEGQTDFRVFPVKSTDNTITNTVFETIKLVYYLFRFDLLQIKPFLFTLLASV